MMDGRVDQQFVELFATSLADDDKKGEPISLLPLVVACVGGLVMFAFAAALA